MAIKNAKREMNNRGATFANNGDVINGDKNETYIFNNYIQVDTEFYNEITNDYGNYSEFYKRYILKFKELEGYAFSLFYPNFSNQSFNYKSNTLIFGKKIIDWVYGNDKFPNKEIQNFYSEIKEEFNFNDNTIIVKRWNANIPYFKGNLKSASEGYTKLFSEVIKAKNIPNWYIDDICIDGRNILSQYGNIINKFNFDNDFQLYINKNNHKLSYPDIDRIKSETYTNVLNHLFKNKNKSKYTTIYGVGLEDCFNQIQNLVFLTVFYGSITHLKLTRELIANLMYMYADTFADEEFYLLTLKMLFLSGEFKKYRNLYNKIKLQYSFVNNNEFINCIIESLKASFDFEQNRNMIFLFDIYGRYINDDLYEKLEEKILDIIKIKENYEINLISNAFKSIATNIKRINNIGVLLEIIKEYFEKSYSRFYIEFGKILNEINVEDLSEIDFLNYQFIIDSLIENKEHINYDISNCIIRIKKRNFDIKKYDKLLKNKGTNENIIYNIEIEEDELKAIKSIVEIYKKRHEEREKLPGLYSGYSTDYNIGTSIFSSKKYKGNVKKFILKEYLPLAKSIVISENENIFEKIRHIKLLAHLLMVESEQTIVDDISYVLHKSLDTKYSELYGIGEANSRNKVDLKINVLMCDAILSSIKFDDLLNEYLIISINNPENIEEILNCVEILMNYKNKNGKAVIDKLFILYTICFKVNDIDIRNKTIILSKGFIGTRYQSRILKILEDRVSQITFEESKGYINLILSSSKKSRMLYKNIIESLKKHENYYIKYMVDKYL